MKLLFAVLALLLGPAARADQRLEIPAPPPALADLAVRGVNHNDQPRIIVVRVDDRPSPDYADRVNEERQVPPGPFMLRLRLASLRTPRGRPLDPARPLRVIAFAPDPNIDIAPLAIEQPAALPAGTLGWFFGPADVVPLRGMQAVGIADPAVSGPALRLVHRASQDPVLAWGTRLTRFEAQLPPGRWHLTLWTEDPGEWETLPLVLERRIRVNGQDALAERRDEAGWLRTRYFAGRDREAAPDQSPFEALGARRGGRVEADVSLDDGKLVVELAGHPQAATHLALLTASPADRPDAAEAAVEAERAARFAENWPVLAMNTQVAETTEAVTAPGGLALFRVTLPPAPAGTARISLIGAGADARLLWGMWRWRRPAPETPGLILSAAHLRGDASVPLRPDLPRPLVVLVPVAPADPAGERSITVVAETAQGRIERSLKLTVLPLRRPEPVARVGVFLDFAPHLMNDPDAARRQAACDMDALRGLGLTAVAPPLATPGDNPATFLQDLRAANARFAPPLIAYAPARRVYWDKGAAEVGRIVADADAAARAAGLVPPVWTVADEPSMAGTMDMASDLAARIRLADRNALLAGHLNDRSDRRILQQLDLVTVNARFGADATDIAGLRGDGRQVWLYNMPLPRLGAGFFLWRSGADGMLQWHARMPTADAFDPTDGREGDVQFLWPTLQVCGPMDLDDDLLHLLSGAEDLRWIAWLSAAAAGGQPAAAALLRQLQSEVPAAWAATAGLPANAPDGWRQRIVELAQSLIQSGR